VYHVPRKILFRPPYGYLDYVVRAFIKTSKSRHRRAIDSDHFVPPSFTESDFLFRENEVVSLLFLFDFLLIKPCVRHYFRELLFFSAGHPFFLLDVMLSPHLDIVGLVLKESFFA